MSARRIRSCRGGFQTRLRGQARPYEVKSLLGALMPFINGRFYMNPAYGRAVEGSRAAEAERNSAAAEPERQDQDAHWVTIDGRHVLIQETQDRKATRSQKQMTLSSKGLDFLARHEALPNGEPALKVYKDSAGNPTIGYGHKILPGEDFSKGITKAQALALLNQDVQVAADEVNAALEVSVTQNQFDALVSFAYNAGPRSVLPGNEMMRAVNGGTVEEANFTAYRYIHVNGSPVVSQGLLNRREDEYHLYSKGIY